MEPEKKEEGIILHKRMIMEIGDKQIDFKGTQNYSGLSLLDNLSLIKCSYLVENPKGDLYIIKVYNFDHPDTAELFISKMKEFQKLKLICCPKVVELLYDKNAIQVSVVEEYIPCLSFKIFVEQAIKYEGMLEKIKDRLILHRLLVSIMDTLAQLEKENTFHGFVNLSNLCIRPTTVPDVSSLEKYVNAIVDGFSISICDAEAHFYLEAISTSENIDKVSIWKTLLGNGTIINAPEFKENIGIGKLNAKYDVWMAGAVILQMISFFSPDKQGQGKHILENLAKWEPDTRRREIAEYVGEITISKILPIFFRDMNERPSPIDFSKFSELRQIELILKADRDSIYNLFQADFEYEPLVSGLKCKTPSISKTAVRLLLFQALKKENTLNYLIEAELYYDIMMQLKIIRQNRTRDNIEILENALKVFGKMIEKDKRIFPNQLVVAGIVSLIIGTIEMNINENVLCEFFSYFGYNSTGTFIHFVEKSGFVNKLLPRIALMTEGSESLKQFFLDTSHYFKYSTCHKNLFNRSNVILECDQFLEEELYFFQLTKAPIPKRVDSTTFKVIKKLIIGYALKYLESDVKYDTSLAKEINTCLYSWLFHKSMVIYSTIHRQCIDYVADHDRVPSSSGFYCTTCSQMLKTDIYCCTVCSFYCHKDHILISAGFQFSRCCCDKGKKCSMKISHDIPSYLKFQPENYLDSLKINFERIPQNFKSESTKNVFVNLDGEIGSLVSTNALCTIPEDTDDIVQEKTLGYYEVEIKLGGFYDQIAVGFTTSNKYQGDEFAGYLEGSIAYHGDDGKIYLNGKMIGNLCSFGSHDVIGCGVTTSGLTFFTHNGNLMSEYKTPLQGPVYPLISLRGKYSSVQVNFEGGFLFNLEDLKENQETKDYIKFTPPSVLECMLINSDWLPIIEKLNELDNQEWLDQLVQYLKSRKDKTSLKESEIANDRLIQDKNFDILRELQSIDILLKESKRSVKEFTLGDGEFFKHQFGNESEFTDVNKSPRKSLVNMNMSEVRHLTQIQINENVPSYRQIQNNAHRATPSNKKKAGLGCGPNSKCNIF